MRTNNNKLKSNRVNVNNHQFIWGSRTYIMGVLNITPDSFSGDGWLTNGVRNVSFLLEKIIERGRQYVDAGVDILDVGGESTRPGSEPISLEEETARVLPVIKALTAEFDTLISVDTYKSQVAKAALEEGAHMINDVWSLQADKNLGKIACQYDVPIILMHNRSKPSNALIQEGLGGRYVGINYSNLIQDICNELVESVNLAHQCGIPDDHIIVDPGIGFGKTVEQNLEVINRLEEIRSLGYPVLLGPSRKSFIGYTLDLPPEQRIEGTAAAVAVGITRSADIIRVHDVEYMVRVARMTDAIVRQSNH